MKILVRRQVHKTQSSIAEQAFTGDRLQLGESADSDIVLPGFSGQLTLTVKNGTLSLSSDGEKLRTPSGGSSRQINLADDASVSAGPFTLTRIEAPPGFDAGLAITGTPDTAALWRRQLAVEPHLPSRRRWSYGLLLLVLLLGGLLPGLSVYEGTRELSRNRLPVNDAIWNTGPISSAHSTAGIALECDACHQTPFVSVTDDSCTVCHSDTREHVDLSHQTVDDFTTVECATCHREHNEPEYLSRRDNGLCTHCHASPESWSYSGDGELDTVVAFTPAGHPSFKYAYWRPKGDGAALGWSRERVRVALGMTPPASSSMLKNNHNVHMNPEKVTIESSGRAMLCADCHQATSDGAGFQPISMDAHCRSCHELSFDVFNPDIELPHGDWRAALVAMEAHFIREFTDPVLRQQRAMEQPRRVPGRRMAAATCDGSGLECGLAEAMKEASYQMTKTGCVTCHEVTDTASPELFDRWQVHPVRLVDVWFPEARFTHASHRNLKGDPEANCLSCHDAKRSELASDVLIPNEDNCLGCHDQTRANAAIDCVSCHGFHRTSGDLSVIARGLTGAGDATTVVGHSTHPPMDQKD